MEVMLLNPINNLKLILILFLAFRSLILLLYHKKTQFYFQETIQMIKKRILLFLNLKFFPEKFPYNPDKFLWKIGMEKW